MHALKIVEWDEIYPHILSGKETEKVDLKEKRVIHFWKLISLSVDLLKDK